MTKPLTLCSSGEHVNGILELVLQVGLGIVLSCYACWAGASTLQETQPNQVISINLQSVSPFQALLFLGTKYHVPLGIVIATPTKLCSPLKTIQFEHATVEQALTKVLSGSDYLWERDGDAYIVKPRAPGEAEEQILNLRLDRFSGSDTTIQGLGIILAGYIHSHLYPKEGYAGDILSTPESEHIPPFTLSNVTVKQVANYIVGLKNKGVWILYPKPDQPEKTQSQQLYTYGYSDDHDLILSLPCSNLRESAHKGSGEM